MRVPFLVGKYNPFSSVDSENLPNVKRGNPKKLPLDKLEQLFYIYAIAVISVNCDLPTNRKITGGSK
jgi:hypothetical protein